MIGSFIFRMKRIFVIFELFNECLVETKAVGIIFSDERFQYKPETLAYHCELCDISDVREGGMVSEHRYSEH